jgi:DNA helicase-2/ATP-dependent DNA helicase PcrA
MVLSGERDPGAIAVLCTQYRNMFGRMARLLESEGIAFTQVGRPPYAQDVEPGTATISTIHSAKGLEWDSVYVIHAADGNIPSDMATGSPEEIEEERRLFYVAMTRAKNHLSVVRPERYYFHNRRKSDQHSLSRVTRFLTPPILAMMEQVSHGLTSGSGGGGPASGLIRGDTAEIRRRIAKLWG